MSIPYLRPSVKLQVIYGYLAEREIEVKNIRILLAAMQAGRTPAEIRALLRA